MKVMHCDRIRSLISYRDGVVVEISKAADDPYEFANVSVNYKVDFNQLKKVCCAAPGEHSFVVFWDDSHYGIVDEDEYPLGHIVLISRKDRGSDLFKDMWDEAAE